MWSFVGFVLITTCILHPTDPHIKVCGKRDSVREARQRIMAVLDTKVSDFAEGIGQEKQNLEIHLKQPIFLYIFFFIVFFQFLKAINIAVLFFS